MKQNIPEGQMSENERNYITDVVKKLKPKISIESGTWYGGGSTLSIVKGLLNTDGVLYTYEEHFDFYDVAKNFYDNSEYTNNIQLFNLSFINGINEFNDKFYDLVDFILLDGGDELPNGSHKFDVNEYIKEYNISENVQSFKILENKIKIGCHLLLHDWSIDIGRGHFVKRYLEESGNIKNFEIINLLNDTTGLIHLKKII
jgi:hypothetical protein